jgi:hypothetical protein
MDSKIRLLGVIGAFAAVIGICPGVARASSVSGKASQVQVTGTSFVMITMDTTPSGSRPSCHNSLFTTHYAFDVSTSKGRALLSTAHAALLGGKSLTVSGGSTCTNTGTVTLETIQALTISP